MITPYLGKVLDYDSQGVDRDLSEIARHMRQWEEQLAVPLGLTQTDIDDIKERHKESAGLQRLVQWMAWAVVCSSGYKH